MSPPFQMRQAVDKEEGGEIFEIPAKFSGLPAGNGGADKNFPARFSEREAQDVGRLVFSAVGVIQPPHCFGRRKDEAQTVLLAEYRVFHGTKRQPAEGRVAFCKVG